MTLTGNKNNHNTTTMRYEYNTNEQIKAGYEATNSFDAILEVVGNGHMTLTEACEAQAQGNCECLFDEEAYDAVMNADKAAKLYEEWVMEELQEDGGDWIYDHRNECDNIVHVQDGAKIEDTEDPTDFRVYKFNGVYFAIDCGDTENVSLLASSKSLTDAVSIGLASIAYKTAA